MARVKIELDLPDERVELITYLKGMSWLFSIQELDEWLKAESKHGDHSDEVFEWIDKTRDQLREIMGAKGVSLYDLEG